MKTTITIAVFLIAALIIKALIRRVWDGSFKKRVSWEYAKSRISMRIMQCPKCSLKPEKLNWFEFRTSNHSWRHLAGRQGFISECPECAIVVEDFITVMN